MPPVRFPAVVRAVAVYFGLLVTIRSRRSLVTPYATCGCLHENCRSQQVPGGVQRGSTSNLYGFSYCFHYAA